MSELSIELCSTSLSQVKLSSIVLIKNSFAINYQLNKISRLTSNNMPQLFYPYLLCNIFIRCNIFIVKLIISHLYAIDYLRSCCMRNII